VRSLRKRCSKEKKRNEKTTQAEKSSSNKLRKRGFKKKAPSPVKKRAVSEDQEGCGQTSQLTSPDKFEENAIENVWSALAFEHCAQNGHEA